MLKLELPNDIQTRLELLSLSTGISIHFFALEAILKYLDGIETRHQAPSEGHGNRAWERSLPRRRLAHGAFATRRRHRREKAP